MPGPGVEPPTSGMPSGRANQYTTAPLEGECKGNCSCAKKGLACTPLCKCYAADCSNHKDYHGDDQDEDMEEEDLD